MSEIGINSIESKILQKQINNKQPKNQNNFKDLIDNAIRKVNDSENESNLSVEKMYEGKTGIHDTMIAVQKADITMRLFLQIRNKAIEAYREIMRMPF